MKVKKILLIGVVFILLFFLTKTCKENFENRIVSLPISSTVQFQATKVLEGTLPKFAVCMSPSAGGKSQCKKGLTCSGNPSQFGNCL